MNWLQRRKNKRADNAPTPSTDEMRLAAAIDAANINERHAAGEDGEYEPRVFVTCPALRGMFLFSPEEAERRIRKAFPHLDDKAVTASVRHLVDRVVIHLTEKTIPAPEARRSWVHGWRDHDELFRL